MSAACSIQDCPGRVKARGWCKKHYQRWQRHGSTEHQRPGLLMCPIDRLTSRTDQTGDCWLWTGPLRPDGYVSVRVAGRTQFAHRVLWELVNGPIPDGLELDHLCSVRHCIRPDHLEPVTPAENMRRMWERRVIA